VWVESVYWGTGADAAGMVFDGWMNLKVKHFGLREAGGGTGERVIFRGFRVAFPSI